MKILWNVQLELKDGTKIDKKCAEYGFNGPGTWIYFVEKATMENMEASENIIWLDLSLVNKINLIRRTIFDTKKEQKTFIDQH